MRRYIVYCKITYIDSGSLFFVNLLFTLIERRFLNKFKVSQFAYIMGQKHKPDNKEWKIAELLDHLLQSGEKWQETCG